MRVYQVLDSAFVNMRRLLGGASPNLAADEHQAGDYRGCDSRMLLLMAALKSVSTDDDETVV
jgi:hypothetical protein